jgi:prepilin-type N-terminal cleavage/methylation domain-containing protein
MFLLKKNHGFTIVELLVVIAIVGILSTVGYASYERVQATARDETRVAELDQIALAVTAYKAEFGHYPREEDGYSGYSGDDFCASAGVIVHDPSVTACDGELTNNPINQLVSDYAGIRPQDPTHSDSGAVEGSWGDNHYYYYNARRECNEDYDIVTVSAQRMETKKYANAEKLENQQCDDLGGEGGANRWSYIKVIDFLPK